MGLPTFPPALRIACPVDGTLTGNFPLVGVNTAELPDGAIAVDVTTYKLYVLHKNSTAPTNDPYIVKAAVGPGSWFQINNGATYFQALNVSHAAIPPQSSVDSPATVNGVAGPSDIVVFNLTDSGLPAGVSISTPRVTGTGAATFRFLNATAATIAAATVALEVAVLPGG